LLAVVLFKCDLLGCFALLVFQKISLPFPQRAAQPTLSGVIAQAFAGDY
jgi:hypothetical protein